MAKVYLRSYRGKEIVDLPPVCIKCGAPATVRKSKRFSWVPPWIGVFVLVPLAYIVMAAVLTKRQRVETPLCEQHKHYWWLYPTLAGLSIAGLLFVGFVVLIAVSALDDGKNSGMAGLACVATLVPLLALLIVAGIMGSMRIRTKEISDRYILLDKVSQEFADAIEEQEEQDRRHFGREQDDTERRPRRRQQGDRYREADDDERYQR